MTLKNIFWKQLKKCALLIMSASLFCSFVVQILLPTGAFGLSQAQLKIFQSNIKYFNADACSPGDGTVKSASSPGPVYILGDSITAISSDTYIKKFKGNGWDPTMAGLATRQIKGDRTAVIDGKQTDVPSGITQVGKDKDVVADAHAIVIGLGVTTYNRDKAFTIDAVKELMSKVRQYNTSAPIYWVNVLYHGHEAESRTTNQAIAEAVGNDATVVNWYAEARSKLDTSKLGDGLHPYRQEEQNVLVNLVYNEVAQGASSTQTGNAGEIYMVGDSITLRAKDDLQSALKAKATAVYINASTSRSITKPGQDNGYKTSGIEAVEGDKQRVEKAGTIIVALGTNPRDGDFKDAIRNMVSKIRSTNRSAKLYWVNTFSEGIDRKGINKDIADLASEGYTVIDTTQADIELAKGDPLHESVGKGTETFAKTVAAAISGDNPTNNDASTDCTCGESTTSLSGEDNAEKIFNYFVSAGYKPFQAAGILGSIKHESGFEPQRQQGVHDRKVPAETLTEAQLVDDDLGWGIVQWTPPGKMIKTFGDRSQANDLATQLDFLKDQLDGKGSIPEKVAGDALKASTNITEATQAFELKYERHAGAAQPQRVTSAQEYLIKFGSGSGSGDPSAPSSTLTCATDDNGEVTGEFSLPVEKKWYDQHRDWFTKPHHDHPGADIPVPGGTKIFATNNGKVTSAGQTGHNGGMGTHVLIEKDGVVYGYFHGIPGSVKVSTGDEVKPGQLLMLVDNTGSSEGNHLHYEIRIGGQLRCPQDFLDAIGKGETPPDPKKLPASGCSY